MRKLLFLALLAALLVGADLAAKSVAEKRIEDRAEEAAGAGASATATIGSFPFLGRLLVSGSVPEVSVRASGVEAGPLTLRAVTVDLDGVKLDRDALFGGDVQLRDIDRGRVTVELDSGVLSRVLDVPITIEDGTVGVEVAGQRVTARAEVREGALVVNVEGLPALTVPIVRTELSPCDVAGVEVRGDRLLLSCQIADVPEALQG